MITQHHTTKPSASSRVARGGVLALAMIGASITPLLCGCASSEPTGTTMSEFREVEPELRRRAVSLMERAERQINEGEYEEAIATLTEAITVYDRIGPMWNNLGIAFERQAQFVDADRAFERAASRDPNNYVPHFNRGLMYYNRGFLRESRPFFEDAIRADDAQLAPLWYAIRVDIALKRETKRTLELVERAMMLESDPDYLQRLRLEQLRIRKLVDAGDDRLGEIVGEDQLGDVAPGLSEEQLRMLAPDGSPRE